MSSRKEIGMPDGYADWFGGFGTPERRTFARFTDKEIKALVEDGAVVYTLEEGSTIASQEKSQREKQKPAFLFVVSRNPQLVDKPSSLFQVAIYPDPERFFIKDSGYKSLDEQQELADEDGEELRKRLGLEGINVVIPEEASTLTGIVFQHFDKTEKWLFGEEYAKVHGLDYVYGRTTNHTYTQSPDVAVVGDATPNKGLWISSRDRHGNKHILAVRLVSGTIFTRSALLKY